jgi:hypothetical protein
MWSFESNAQAPVCRAWRTSSGITPPPRLLAIESGLVLVGHPAFRVVQASRAAPRPPQCRCELFALCPRRSTLARSASIRSVIFRRSRWRAIPVLGLAFGEFEERSR